MFAIVYKTSQFLHFLCTVLQNALGELRPPGNALVYTSPEPDPSWLQTGEWCGLRPSVLGEDWSQARNIRLGFGLAGLVLCSCETRSCHARRHNDPEGHSSFSSTIYSFSRYSVLGTSLLWRSTVAYTYLKDKSAKCLCLLSVVLVFDLRIWSCLHHWH